MSPPGASTAARRTAAPPLIWALQSGSVGDDQQVLALAEALGWPFEVKRLVRRSGGIRARLARKGLLGASLACFDSARSSPLTPPWPALVIGASRGGELAAAWIARRAGRRPRLVHLGCPKGSPRGFDLIVATPQHALPPCDNVLMNDLPLHRVTPARLRRAAAAWAPLLAHLPPPRIAVLVGGDHRDYVLDPATARRLGRLANRMARACAGSLLVTDSARTDSAAYAALLDELDVPLHAHRWRHDAAANPYLGYLALADRFVVTAESTSMLVEAAASGRPVLMFDTRQRRTQGGRRDIGRIHERLLALGHAGWLDETLAVPPAPGAPPGGRDLERAVARVRALFGMAD